MKELKCSKTPEIIDVEYDIVSTVPPAFKRHPLVILGVLMPIVALG